LTRAGKGCTAEPRDGAAQTSLPVMSVPDWPIKYLLLSLSVPIWPGQSRCQRPGHSELKWHPRLSICEPREIWFAVQRDFPMQCSTTSAALIPPLGDLRGYKDRGTQGRKNRVRHGRITVPGKPPSCKLKVRNTRKCDVAAASRAKYVYGTHRRTWSCPRSGMMSPQAASLQPHGSSWLSLQAMPQ
jgi:hypothetical protein